MNTERARLVESGFPVSGLMKYLTSLVFSCDVIKIMPLFISAFYQREGGFRRVQLTCSGGTCKCTRQRVC